MSKTFILHQDTDNWYSNKNLFYILWFDTSLGTIIFDDKKIILVFDARYYKIITNYELRIKKRFTELFKKDFEVETFLLDWNLFDKIEKYIKWKEIILEENIPTIFYKNIKKLGPKSIELIWNIFEKERLIKTPKEIKNIKKAIQIIEKVFVYLYKNKESLIWKKETDVRQIIQKLILDFWGTGESFPSIIAFWKNSSIPHHQTWNTIIWNWPLLIDMWAIYEWYCSDFTRTFWIWEKTSIYNEFIKVKNIVKKAHDLWIDFVKENILDTKKNLPPFTKGGKEQITWKNLDKVVRDFIEKGWYWEYFTHSTWHWVWLQIHEQPRISSKKQDQALEKWMVFTVEPGIYLPWKFGVRWENIVVL